jgi:hypothetical protein
MTTPAETLRSAAALMRERAQAATSAVWDGRPWQAEECSDDEAGNCPCIVSQGERKPPLEAQVPHIQYVCDAESWQHAAHIASWHPAVALAVADWLDAEAERAAQIDAYQGTPAYPLMLDGYRHPLAVARAFLGEAGRG